MTPQSSCKYNGHGFNDDGVCIYCHEDDGTQTKASDEMTPTEQDKELREILDGSLDAVRQTCSECNHPRCHGIINSLEVTLNVWHRQAIEHHTNAEIAKVLDRLESEMNRYTAEHDVPMRDEAIDAIQAERSKLKEVK